MLKNYIESLFYSPDDKDYTDLSVPVTAKWSALEGNGEIISQATLSPSIPCIGNILHFHGSGYNITKHLGHVSWLVDFGFRVHMFDYPGYGKSTGIPTRESVSQCALDVYHNCIQKFGEPFFIFGQSLGGAIAMEVLSKVDTPKVNALILDSTFSSYQNLAKIKIKRKGFPHTWFERIIVNAMDSKQNPVEFVTKLKLPILLLHSKTDSIVPFTEAELLYESIQNTCDFWVQDGPDHTDVFRPDYEDYRLRLVNWIKNTL